MVLDDSQSAIQGAIRAWAAERVAPFARQWEAAGAYPAEIFGELAALGLLGMTAPEEFGGAGADYVSYALALMELAAADGGLSTIVSVHNAPVIAALLAEGTSEQRSRFMPKLCSGALIGAFALTESEAGSDAAAIRTRAARLGSEWRLDGTKQFITSGRIAGLTIVFALTDPAAGRRGISAFLVPAGTPGVAATPLEPKLGQRACETCTLHFDSAPIDDALRLGEVGGGYRIALANLESGRIGVGAQSVGMAQAALDIAIAYAKERKTFGKPIFEHQAVGFRLADLAARLEASRQLVLHAASLKDAHRPCLREASMAKLVASEMAETVCSAAIQTPGAPAIWKSTAWRRSTVTSASARFTKASDILRMVIARSL